MRHQDLAIDFSKHYAEQWDAWIGADGHFGPPLDTTPTAEPSETPRGLLALIVALPGPEPPAHGWVCLQVKTGRLLLASR